RGSGRGPAGRRGGGGRLRLAGRDGRRRGAAAGRRGVSARRGGRARSSAAAGGQERNRGQAGRASAEQQTSSTDHERFSPLARPSSSGSLRRATSRHSE